MADVLALIPARAGSKGVPNKNFRDLAGRSPVARAIDCALALGLTPVVSTDDATLAARVDCAGRVRFLPRPAAFATDDAPMLDVIRDVLCTIDGPPEQIVLLLQPTQPLRTPEHIKQAIALMELPDTDSVVSVVPLPASHHPHFVGSITPNGHVYADDGAWPLVPTRRQDTRPVYIRDGTVYAFRRRTLTEYGSIYGLFSRALIIPPEHTCPLDTELDWLEAERRLRALS